MAHYKVVGSSASIADADADDTGAACVVLPPWMIILYSCQTYLNAISIRMDFILLLSQSLELLLHGDSTALKAALRVLFN